MNHTHTDKLALSTFFFAVMLSACHAPPQTVETYNSIRVGDPLPEFAFWSEKGIFIQTSDLSARFFIYFAHPKLGTTMCFNLECGADSKSVTLHGGILIGGVDGKYTKSLGVKGYWPDFTPLFVVADAEKRITAIYPNAQMYDLEFIVKQHVVSYSARGSRFVTKVL